MLIVGIIGTPSPLTYICANILRAVVQVSCGDHHLIGANTVTDLRHAWPSKEGRKAAVLLTTDMPDPELINFLVNAKTPLVTTIEPLDAIANYMIGMRDIEPVSAMRVGSQALAVFEALAVASPRSVMRLRPTNARLSSVVGELLSFCQDDGEPETVARVVEFLGYESRPDIPFAQFLSENRANLFPVSGPKAAFNQTLVDAMAQLAQGYRNVVESQPIAEVTWPGACFMLADSGGLRVESDLMLEGRARFLSHGPYFHLPPGEWDAEVAVEVSESFSDNRVGFDVWSEELLAAVWVTLPARGAFACDLSFRVDDVTKPIEIRIQLLSGAIEGRLKLNGVRLTRR